MPQGNEELWAEYGIGAFLILLRFVARWKVIGIQNFQIEDLFMLIALISYTAITVLIHLITVYGSTIGQTAESVYLLTDEQVASFTIGQQLTWADWIIYLLYIWSLKAVLLTTFSRLAQGLARETRILNFIIGYTVVAFFGAALTHICVCLPVERSWQVVPYPGDACALRNLNYYLVSFFNASSDLAIMAFPIPIVFRVKIPLWRRITLLLLLCSGVFIIIATILRAYYSLQSITLLPVAAGWTSRETFAAAVVVSIPGIKPLFSRSKWFRFRSTADDYNYKKGSAGMGASHELRTIGMGGPHPAGDKGYNEWTVGGKEVKGTRLSDGGSEDLILSDRDDGKQSTSVFVAEDKAT